MTVANAVQPSALAAFLSGAVDVTTDVVKVQLVNTNYSYSSAHDFLDDVPASARFETAATLAGKTVTGGSFAASAVQWVEPAAGTDIAGMVVYADLGGSDATRRYLAYINRKADTMPFEVTTDGGDIVVTWPNGVVFKI